MKIRDSKKFKNLMKLQQENWNKFWQVTNSQKKSKISEDALEYKNLSDNYLQQAINLIK